MGSGGSTCQSRFSLTAQDIVNECRNDISIEHLHILVTGATAGIGIETGRALACAGAKVYLLGRDESKLKDVVKNIETELKQQGSTGSVQGFVCDLNNLVTIKRCAQEFVQAKIPLNRLLLNAGLLNTEFIQTVDGLEQVVGVNHIGHAYLTQLLMPTLITNAPSRIVVVSSKAHTLGGKINYQRLDRMNSKEQNAGKGWGTITSYHESKLANVLFARAIASRYGAKQVTAYSLHPGVMDTALMFKSKLIHNLSALQKRKSLAQGAATTVYCALKSGLENESGRYFDDSSVTKQADKFNDNDIDELWNWTEKVIRERTANI
ncbi:unnamed protein product [Adineta steineri]|uniref:Uncharacterized protein n=1 Tax=Adineta steineri TaxID=433720 RepID=A0A819X0V4_9BILA|nr:unnamed protein product [Adineta steineri]CAF4133447.1 unnamed protein product [Adineta steineri]